jgi:WD40 repeat protein
VRGKVFQVAAGSGRVAAADDASTATTIDATTGAVLMERSHTGKLTSIAMSDDGQHVVTGSTARLVHLFTAEKGVPVWAATLGGAVNDVAISGQRVAAACADRTARLYSRDAGADPEQQSPLWTSMHPQSVTAVALGAHHVATACNDHVTRILDLRDGTELHRISHPNGRASGIAFSGDLLAVGVTDGTARVVDAATGTTLRQVTHPSDVVAVAISADGTLATAGAEQAVRLWNATGVLLHTLPQTSPVTALSFHPGRSLAIATESGLVSIVGPDGAPAGRIAHPAVVRHLAHSADGTVLATACDDEHVRTFSTIPL